MCKPEDLVLLATGSRPIRHLVLPSIQWDEGCFELIVGFFPFLERQSFRIAWNQQASSDVLCVRLSRTKLSLSSEDCLQPISLQLCNLGSGSSFLTELARAGLSLSSSLCEAYVIAKSRKFRLV